MPSRPSTSRTGRAPTEPPRSPSGGVGRRRGTYHCARCGSDLFGADAQFEFGTGCWPNFTGPLSATVVDIRDKWAGAQIRHEVLCAECTSHVGHVFSDGPGRTAERYCIAWAALRFAPDDAGDDGPPPDYPEEE